ncbi:MAG: CBS domain-containing protein [Halofilum sp. (in: g-proteobacteria)]|nr:CBS domain-containing protein [Halofilum sp. (in: g-proteobacteria)]
MRVEKMCNRAPISASATDTVRAAAALMRAYHIGDVVVVDEQHGRRRPVGLVTDRDLVLEVVDRGGDPRPCCSAR